MLPRTSMKDSAVPETDSRVGEGAAERLRGPTLNSVGEPDAANPHVRFDEREVETGHGQASEAPADERAGNRWV